MFLSFQRKFSPGSCCCIRTTVLGYGQAMSMISAGESEEGRSLLAAATGALSGIDMAPPLDSRGFHLHRTREENVVFQMHMLVKIRFEFPQILV